MDRSEIENRVGGCLLGWSLVAPKEADPTWMMKTFSPIDETFLTDYITRTFADVETMNQFGYTFFFYDSDQKLPFATIASSDNEYDRVSNLDRPGVFRLNIGVSKATFQSLLGRGPAAAGAYDFKGLDRIMPHPHYAAQRFICVLNPSGETFEKLKPFLAEAYNIAVRRHTKFPE